MKNSLQLLAVSILLVASLIGCVGCTVVRTEPTVPTMPDAQPEPDTKPTPPPPKPKPAPAKIVLLLFTQPGCGPCLTLKAQLKDPALHGIVEQSFSLEEVKPPDGRFREYHVSSTPTLIALTASGPKRYPNGGTLGQLAKWLSDVAENKNVDPAPAPSPDPAPFTPRPPHRPPYVPKPLPRGEEAEGGPSASTGFGKFVVGGEVGPEGQEIITDLPKELRKHNISSRGQGCCVHQSTNHAAKYQNVPVLWDFAEWVRSKGLPGGCYPEAFTERVRMIAKDRGMPEPLYLQYEGRDPAVLELALKTGRMPIVTYNGHDGVLYPSFVAHMVNLTYLDDKSAAILDNNAPTKIIWCSRQEFLDRWTGGRAGWAVVLLKCRPPSPPKNPGK